MQLHRKKIWVAFDSHALFDRFHSAAGVRADRKTAEAAGHLRRLGRHHEIHVLWVPGHAGLPLNEMADEAAKRGSRMPQEAEPPTASSVRATAKRMVAVLAELGYRDDLASHGGLDHVHLRATGGKPLPDYAGRSRRKDVLLSRLRLNRAPWLRSTLKHWGEAESDVC